MHGYKKVLFNASLLWKTILYSVHLQDSSYGYCDLGGAYVCETQTRLLRLAKELGVETYQVYGQGNTVENYLVHFISDMMKYSGLYLLLLHYSLTSQENAFFNRIHFVFINSY